MGKGEIAHYKPLSTVFQSYHSDSSHYSCLSWVIGHSHKKTQRIKCGLSKSSKLLSIKGLRTGGPWFNPTLGPIIFQELTASHLSGFVSLQKPNIVLLLIMWENSDLLGKNTVSSIGMRNSRKPWVGTLATAIYLK